MQQGVEDRFKKNLPRLRRGRFKGGNVKNLYLAISTRVVA